MNEDEIIEQHLIALAHAKAAAQSREWPTPFDVWVGYERASWAYHNEVVECA